MSDFVTGLLVFGGVLCFLGLWYVAPLCAVLITPKGPKRREVAAVVFEQPVWFTTLFLVNVFLRLLGDAGEPTDESDGGMSA